MTKANNGQGQSDSVLALGQSWSLWEKYADRHGNSKNYGENHEVIYTFHTLPQFAHLWKNTTYSTPSHLLYDIEREKIKSFYSRGSGNEEKSCDGFFLFKENVQPKWEDPKNSQGCSLHVELFDMLPKEIDELWKILIFEIVRQGFPHYEVIVGLRLLDRMQSQSKLKIELWLSVSSKFGDDKIKAELYQEKITDIMSHFHKLISQLREISLFSIINQNHFKSLNENKIVK